ncbi:MAG: terminase small subunit [Alphaproteobacteria bacterium]|nr:terminase small subunit [Alphaproteobacteria bacterium]
MTKSHDGAATTQDEIFALAYIKTFDPAAAWLEAVPDGNKKYAIQNGSKWLKKPVIRERLRHLAAQKIEKADVEADKLIAELERIAFLDPAEFMEVDEDGEPVLNLTSLTPENRRLLNIEFGIGVSKDGDRIRTYKVKAHDKMEAIEKLLKLHQLYKADDLQRQPMAIQVNVNIPLPGSQWRVDQAHQTDVIDPEDI